MSTETGRRTPLYDTHLEAGAKMSPYAGWEMPISYDGIKEEHLAVRTHAGMFDVSHMGQLEVEGPDAERYLQRVLSNDVTRMADGEAQYSCLCDEHGGITDDVIAYRLTSQHYLVVTNAANHATDLRSMARWVHDFDCVLRDIADRWAMIAVQGPHARDIVKRQLGVELPPRMGVLPAKVEAAPAVICGTGYTGEDGVEIMVDPGRASAVWSKLQDGGVVPCGLGARDSLRLEVCFPLHGNDISADTNPIEAGLGWACREQTGFVGAAPVAEVRAAGPERLLVPFKIDGAGIARQGNPVLDPSGRQVGEVTSGSHSPSLGIGIGMAYVETPLAVPGQRLDIDVRGRMRHALIAEKPLYRKDETNR